jgi:hypothetical protein
MSKARVHRCKQNPHPSDVAIRFERINVEKSHWVCVQTEFATRAPDKKGRAQKTATPVAFHIMLIRFCPFCGKELSGL